MKERSELQSINRSLTAIKVRSRVNRVGIAFCWLCLLLTAPFMTFAQSKSPALPVVVADDRSAIRVRYPAPSHLNDLQSGHDYQYGRDTSPPENPLARLWAWFIHKIGKFLSSEAYENIWQYVFLAIIAGGAIYLLMKAEVLGFLFSKKAQSAGLAYENLAENIHEIDFVKAVDEAVNQRNFRLAVRLLYLQTLKHLSDAGRIDYKPDKTNRQYVYELANSSVQPDFEKLTRQFEFVWYGDFPIDEAQFVALQTAFNQFNRAVNQHAIS